MQKINFDETLSALKSNDSEVFELTNKELERQKNTIDLIASENFTYAEAMEVAGSVLTNKYAEGYPGKRYYGGCEVVDEVEELAISRACQLFGAKHANVQPHSGSSANFAVYTALCDAGDTIMGMTLDCGGHLTHGAPVSFSGKYFNSVSYTLDPETELLNYDAILEQAKEVKPKLIVAGYSTYPRFIDFARFKEIADEVGALLMVDTAHIAGLIAGGVYPSPIEYADVVTGTTHKTLRGPRSGMILCNSDEIAKKVDKAVFPGCQGGPLMHIIAAKAICFKHAMSDDFKTYAKNVVDNTAAMAKAIEEGGLRLVSGGTDNHICLIDCQAANVSGAEVEAACDKANIVLNKNSIPFDKTSPNVCSGIRIGAAPITSRGFNKDDCYKVAQQIAKIAFNVNDENLISQTREMTKSLCEKYPLYE